MDNNIHSLLPEYGLDCAEMEQRTECACAPEQPMCSEQCHNRAESKECVLSHHICSNQVVLRSCDSLGDRLAVAAQPGAGVGLVCTRRIAKGEIVCAYLGKVVRGDATGEYISRLPVALGRVDCSAVGTLARFANSDSTNPSTTTEFMCVSLFCPLRAAL